MEKPFYKYNTYWLALTGLGLSYVYVKFLAKNKNLSLGKSLLTGSILGAGIGLGIDFMSKPKQQNEEVKPEINEQSLRELASSISPNAETELSNYLFLLDKTNLPLNEKKKAYNVLNGFLLAKKDDKWDSQADINGMKKTLLSYGVTEDDFKVFQSILVSGLATSIASIFQRKPNIPN